MENLLEPTFMSSNYANITLKGPTAQDIMHELDNLGRSAFIAPTVDGLTTVFDMDSDEGDIDTLSALAEDLSSYFGCPVLAVQGSDEEMLQYRLFADGDLLDSYTSPVPARDLGETGMTKSVGGKADVLAQQFAAESSSEDVAEVLHCPDDDCSFTLAVDRHLSLAELLGLPLYSVGFGFNHIESGEYPEELEEDDLLRLDVD